MKKITTVIIIFGFLIAASAYNANHIPEPASMILIGSGLIGLAGFGRKRLVKKS